MRSRVRRLGVLLLSWCFLAGTPAFGQITVTGLEDQETYDDSVSFTIQAEAGYDYTAHLIGEPVPVDRAIPIGVSVNVDEPEYYELRVERTNKTSGAKESSTIQFIVRATERESAEDGLRPWVPYPVVDSASTEFAGGQLQVILPAAYPAGMAIPVYCRVAGGAGKRLGVNGSVEAAELPGHRVRILRGVGSGSLPAAPSAGTLSYTARMGPLETPKQVQIEGAVTWTSLTGAIATSRNLGEDARINVTGTITVASGATLTIGAGSVVKVAADAEIEVNGKLVVSGTPERPVALVPANPSAPWGGFLIRGSSAVAEITGALATGACADPDWFDNNPDSGSTHLDNQALLYVSGGANVTMTDTALFDCHGQAGHGESSYLTWTRCLIQRFLTGGEYAGCVMNLQDCAIIEFPGETIPFADDDGDAIYFIGGSTIATEYNLTDCLIGWAHDDGVDSGSGSGCRVNLTGCWIEADYHEGLAWSSDSGTRLPVIRDTVVMNCGQGIECGWGDPEVDADRCLSTTNLVGTRLGDNYDWDYEGSLKVRNSLLLHNVRNVWGRNWDDWMVRLSQMDIQGNYLSEADPDFPNNTVWQPDVDAPRLAPFLPTPAGKVGLAIVTAADRFDISKLGDGVPVRLSTFSTSRVSVEYALRSSVGPVGGGTLEFLQGEMAKKILLDDEALAGHDLVILTLSSPVNAELTGRTSVEFVRRILTELIPAGSSWKYLDTGVDQGTAWRAVGFNDSSWQQGPADLGYGDDQLTEVNGGPSDARFPTIYFRRTFTVSDPAAVDSILVSVRRDDGAVAYINGVEVFRSNMPEGTIEYSTWASGNTSSESAFFSKEVAAGMLVAGTNVIAVEVHQVDETSSDLTFDLALSATMVPVITGTFVRGEANGDGSLDISDPVTILFYLFVGGVSAPCPDAMDANDSGLVDLSDAVYLLRFLFLGGPGIPAPYPSAGLDPTEDSLPPCE